ncbi:hypothetical protein ASPCAL03439 [Aspergillus calidoustus]|uniref:BHLH domain-containing protein n=1 Tax=Aspergillus calidoustus TaxID=454130 RepID=A0A0U5C3Q6_ASPCI|nr:hypothetical protein ASPCAL03439 [Aspergillus calidoustus]
MAYNMSPDPLSANWSYDSAIDLFSLNTMMPESFPMDIPNDLFLESKDLPSDFWAAPTDINGFTVSNEDSLSSVRLLYPSAINNTNIPQEESDDQSYSPTNFMSSTPPASADISLSSPIALPQTASQSAASKRKAASISTRYSSSPELHPQQQPTTTSATTATTSSSTSTGRKSRNNSDDSTRGRNAAKRAAHNIIEKRYRTNMNAKFVALEKAMAVKPSGSGVSKTTSTSASGVKSSASLKKSEILSNAIAYMQELQEANERLRKEVATLNRRVSYC